MIAHCSLGNTSYSRSKNLYQLIAEGKICFGGNKQLKIFGKLDCLSGKRMKIINRVFFSSINEAETAGFRPCGHCMKKAYLNWKNKIG